MHRVALKLNRLTKGLIEPIPIIVPDGYSILSGDGSMTAIFPNGQTTPPLLWEQVSGVPVTFTSPLDEPTITFTSTDLAFKEFKCTTYPTDPIAARFDIGKFFSYPLDTENTNPTLPIDTVLVEAPDYSLNIVPGVGNPILGSYSNVSPYKAPDLWTSIGVTVIGELTRLKLYYSEGGSFLVLHDTAGMQVPYPYIDNISYDTDLLLEITQIINGHVVVNTIAINKLSDYTYNYSGYMDKTLVNANVPMDSLLTSFSTSLQTINRIALSDVEENIACVPVDTAFTSYDVHLQSLLDKGTILDTEEISSTVPIDAIITAYSYTLSNYIGVT